MCLLFNFESNGIGKPSEIPSGLRAIRELLNDDSGLAPSLAMSSDYALVSRVKALPILIENALVLRAAFEKIALLEDEPLVSLGGDCGSELAPIAWLNERLEGRLQVVWFDAHADLNTPATSPSGAFHGMVLRTLCGEGPSEMASLVPRPLLPAQILLAGVRELDPEEERYIKALGIRQLTASTINGSPKCVADALNPELPTYIHVDYDVLDGERHPESSYPASGGLDLDALIAAIVAVRRSSPIAGMSLTEFAPPTDGSGAHTVRRILSEGFGLTVRSAMTFAGH